MQYKRPLCVLLALALLVCALPPAAAEDDETETTAAEDALLDAPEDVSIETGAEAERFTLGNTSEMMLLGGGRMVQTDEGLYFLAEADGGIYLTDGETTRCIESAPCRCLNYIDGTLFFAKCGEGDRFSLWRILPGGEREQLLAETDGPLGQFYATSSGVLYWLAGETVWRMPIGGEPTVLRTVAGIVSFVPTFRGLVYACGEALHYDVYVAGVPIIENADSYCVMEIDGDDVLVFSEDGEDYQISLAALYAGDGSLSAFSGYGEVSLQSLMPEDAAEAVAEAREYVSVEPGSESVRTANVIPTQTRAVTQGTVNIALRAYQMTDIKWKAVKDVAGWNSRMTYTAGSTYVGLPYGQPVGDHYVPWDADYSEFFRVVADPDSDFYTRRSDYADGLTYAVDCSSFVSWAWQTKSRLNTSGLAAEDVATVVSNSSYASAQIGDILNNVSTHVVLITNVRYDSSGAVSAIEIAHADVALSKDCCCYREWFGSGYSFSLADFQSRFFSQGYKLYRNPKRDSVTFTAEPNIPVSHDAAVTATSSSTPNLHYGVDVSQWQYTIDWKTASKYIEFAIIRSQSGVTVLDNQWSANVTGCIKNKIPYGVYVYAKALTAAEAVQEARLCLSQLGGRKPDLPIFYDVEDDNLSLPNDKLYEVVSAFCSTIEAAGLRAGVYCSTNFWNTKLSDSRYGKWCRWVAQWADQCTYKAGLNLWQYSCTGTNPGIYNNSGNPVDVDLNVWIGDVGDYSHRFTMQQTAPSCTKSGKNIYTSTDGEIKWIQKLSALGHTYENGVCTRCSLPTPSIATVLNYQDVSASAWYYSAVRYVVQRGLFSGMSATEFAPNRTMTRGMLVTVLWRLAGCPKVIAYNPFADVPAGKYYTMPVVWAYHKGLVNGITAKSFRPEQEITREQMAAILYRYAGASMSYVSVLSHYSDAGEVSSYAKLPMAWAVSRGLIQGMDNNTLNPKGNATRAQVATILQRYDGGTTFLY